jgi:hypothetical protein
VKERHPELRVIPRISQLATVDAMVEAGVDGAVVDFDGDEQAMRELARRYR